FGKIRHMTADHYGQTARRATLLVTATDEILGTHRADSNVMDMAAAAIANCQAWFPAPAGIGRAVLAPPGTLPVVGDPLEKV
ncbi:MAG TPA: hypothetical protein VN776_03180, partial [Terracidiphilus sp.]|nr:hypothetical protein [Terracidiphilus sp.]